MHSIIRVFVSLIDALRLVNEDSLALESSRDRQKDEQGIRTEQKKDKKKTKKKRQGRTKQERGGRAGIGERRAGRKQNENARGESRSREG